MGLEVLRVQVAAYLAVARGIVCSPAQVIITGGYQGALGMISRCLLHPDDHVWLEDPCYPDSRDAMRLAGANMIGIPVDRKGLRFQDAISRQTPA